MSKTTSARQKEAASRRVLDDASRQRRARKALEALEADNNCEDPHADLVMSKKALSLFQDEGGDSGSQERRPKRKARTMEYYKLRFRKNLAQLLEEESNSVEGEEEGELVGYLAAQVPDTIIPPRNLCAVCGFPSPYTCSTCGTRYCSLRCLETHQDTRCLKWTA
eukprot:GFUD01012042.1.p2 GENE.GFUD01012042.1~~GFUD01012042.1.p2  ORF type:complete len:165 (-),score=49.79 GFUD01012042.1:342-836(-)